MPTRTPLFDLAFQLSCRDLCDHTTSDLSQGVAGKTPRTKEERTGLGGAGSFFVGLLRRRGGSNGYRLRGNDLGTDHFARDDQLDAAVLLTAFGGIV